MFGNNSRTFTAILAALTLVLPLLSGCASTPSGITSQTQSASQASAQSTETATQKAGPYDKYDPVISMVSALQYYDATKFLNGDTADNNLITKTFKNELGIDITYKFSAPAQQYTDKVNIAIASADIPDAFIVTKDQYAKLLKTDMLADDLTSVVNNNASDILKSILVSDGGVGMKVATKNDKLRAIPYVDSSLDRAEVMYLRNDWLKKVGLEAPKTVDDLVKTLDAFVHNDPDGNGQNDTSGLVANKTLFLDFASFQSIFAAYNAFPRLWIEKDGKLAYGSFQPEMKKALEKLHEMYAAGLIDKEFSVKDFGKAAEPVIAGKAGAFFGNITLPIWPCGLNMMKENNAEWGFYPAVSGEAQEPKVVQPNAVQSLYVIRKGYEHPEAVVRIMNLMLDKLYGASSAAQYHEFYGVDEKTSTNPHLNPFKMYNARKNYSTYQVVKKAIADGNPAGLNPEDKNAYDLSELWLKNKDLGENGINFGMDGVFNTPSTYDVVDGYVKGNRLLDDAFYGAPTPAMTSRLSSIDNMIDEVITKIIMGAAPIDEFDKAVSDAMNLGGQQMTDEANQWHDEIK